jgi:hypothetical protein
MDRQLKIGICGCVCIKMYENAPNITLQNGGESPKKIHHKKIQYFNFKLKYKLCDCIKRMVQKFMTISSIAFLTQDFKLGKRLKSVIVIVSKERCSDQIF